MQEGGDRLSETPIILSGNTPPKRQLEIQRVDKMIETLAKKAFNPLATTNFSPC